MIPVDNRSIDLSIHKVVLVFLGCPVQMELNHPIYYLKDQVLKVISNFQETNESNLGNYCRDDEILKEQSNFTHIQKLSHESY